MHMFPEIKERRCPHINVAVKAEMGVLQRTKSLSAKEIRKRQEEPLVERQIRSSNSSYMGSFNCSHHITHLKFNFSFEINLSTHLFWSN